MKPLKTNQLKIINDPIYGFITIPNQLIFEIIDHPYFQRLRRISQMGFSSLVYPGANHTRFHHAIGCMHLMQKTVEILRFKNICISDREANALYIAILLHDIGHGAFSHALEHNIVNELSHEEISLKFMRKLNVEFNGQLTLAIEIFEGKYHRNFFNQLISSQLDIDRLDYLKRDSFYTGVSEGNINSNRLIAMMHVKNDELVIEQKGIYSVENFLIARRLMYWQVYFHKASLVAENMLELILKRAKELAKKGVKLTHNTTLNYFLHKNISTNNFTDTILEKFSKLDDYDVLSAVKEWRNHSDVVLSKLAKMIINRQLLKIEIQGKPFAEKYTQKIKKKIENEFDLSNDLINYFIFKNKVSNQAYDIKNPIKIIMKNGKLKDIIKASDQLNLKALTKPVLKYYFCYPKK